MTKKILLTTILLTLLLPCFVAAQGNSMTIAYPDFHPFFSRTEDNRMTGIFYEIIKIAIEEQMNVEVKWEKCPWKRCQKNVENGKADAMITTVNPKRLAYSKTHEQPFFEQYVNIFTYAHHPRLSKLEQIKNFEDIRNENFSIITYLGNGWIEKNAESLGIKIHKTTIRDKTWKMLAMKRGDIVIEWPAAAWPEIHKEQLQGMIVDTNAVMRSVSLHLLISKKSPYVQLLPKFNEIVQEMAQNGTIKEITDKYFKPKIKQ